MAVNGISFSVRQSEVFCMLKANSAGKTTTVEILEGLRSADYGQISVLNIDVAKTSTKSSRRLASSFRRYSYSHCLKLMK